MIIAAHKQGFTFDGAQTPFPFSRPPDVKPRKLFPSEIFSLFGQTLCLSFIASLCLSARLYVFQGFFFFLVCLILCQLHTHTHTRSQTLTEVTVSKQCLVEEPVLNRSLSEIGCFNCCQRQDGSGGELEQLKGFIQNAVTLFYKKIRKKKKVSPPETHHQQLKAQDDSNFSF